MAGPWGCMGWLERGQRRGIGRSRSRGGETLKLSPSSRVVCRLPSELPVAREESLWDRCCTQRREVVKENKGKQSFFNGQKIIGGLDQQDILRIDFS